MTLVSTVCHSWDRRPRHGLLPGATGPGGWESRRRTPPGCCSSRSAPSPRSRSPGLPLSATGDAGLGRPRALPPAVTSQPQGALPSRGAECFPRSRSPFSHAQECAGPASLSPAHDESQIQGSASISICSWGPRTSSPSLQAPPPAAGGGLRARLSLPGAVSSLPTAAAFFFHSRSRVPP